MAAGGLDLAAVERWWPAGAGPVTPPLSAAVISGGHSNITYRLADATGAAYVLRRPPGGDLPPGAHDVLREARIMRALAGSGVPVPVIAATCADPAVLGAPFYLMRWVDGAVVGNPADVARALPGAAARRAAAESLVDVLATMHAVDTAAVGLADLARPGDYLDRQLGRMWQVWERSRTRDLPLVGDLHARLLRRKPPQRHAGLVHSDYRLGNVMLDQGGRVVAVLDWELAAIGDVLCDLGFLLNNWEAPEEPGDQAWMQEPPTRAGGFPARDDLVARYEHSSGFDVSDLDYYRAFTYWRMAVIAEGIKRRYESGAMAGEDVDFDHLERRVRRLADLADERLRAVRPAR